MRSLPLGVSGELACCIPGLVEVVSFDTHSLSAGPDLLHGVRPPHPVPTGHLGEQVDHATEPASVSSRASIGLRKPWRSSSHSRL